MYVGSIDKKYPVVYTSVFVGLTEPQRPDFYSILGITFRKGDKDSEQCEGALPRQGVMSSTLAVRES